MPVAAGDSSCRARRRSARPSVNPRIAASPAPAVIHITSGELYLLAGVLQFSAALRRRCPRGHVRARRLLAVLGLAVAASAILMTLPYPREPGMGSRHYGFRLAFALSMASCLVLGVVAIRRGNLETHRAWMMRAYALAAGAGTQVFTQGFAETVGGDGELSGGLALGAGGVINPAVVEHVISRRKAAPAMPAGAMVGS